jgi:hypothetical protein
MPGGSVLMGHYNEGSALSSFLARVLLNPFTSEVSFCRQVLMKPHLPLRYKGKCTSEMDFFPLINNAVIFWTKLLKSSNVESSNIEGFCSSDAVGFSLVNPLPKVHYLSQATDARYICGST